MPECNDAEATLDGLPARPLSRPRRVRSLRQRLRLPLMIGVPALAALVGGYLYVVGGRYVSTDDAFVQAARVDVSPDVPGRVVAIDVHDNQTVKAGQVLFRLDDRPFAIAVQQAKAQLAASRLAILRMKTAYREKVAELQSAQDTLTYRRGEFERQKRLLATGIASQAQYDQANNALVVARQQVASTEQQAAGILADLDNDVDLPVDSHPSVQQAQATLDRAELDLSYATVRASIDGVVTKVDQMQVGDYVGVAKPVFSLVSSRRLWIEANFKETDLTHMRPGQTATIRIDTYPDRTFIARVTSLSPGTGSVFSLLPPENATGNWVKVVQRLPVRLELQGLPDGGTLHAGLSADVEVDTHYERRVLALIDSAFAGGREAPRP